MLYYKLREDRNLNNEKIEYKILEKLYKVRIVSNGTTLSKVHIYSGTYQQVFPGRTNSSP